MFAGDGVEQDGLHVSEGKCFLANRVANGVQVRIVRRPCTDHFVLKLLEPGVSVEGLGHADDLALCGGQLFQSGDLVGFGLAHQLGAEFRRGATGGQKGVVEADFTFDLFLCGGFRQRHPFVISPGIGAVATAEIVFGDDIVQVRQRAEFLVGVCEVVRRRELDVAERLALWQAIEAHAIREEAADGTVGDDDLVEEVAGPERGDLCGDFLIFLAPEGFGFRRNYQA